MVGWTDHPADLSDTEKVARLAAGLPQAPVLSSDLLRARQTADAIAGDRTRLPASPALREFHYGDWEDRAFDEIDSPDLRLYFDDPGDRRAPGGESWNDVAARVKRAIAPLCGAYPDVIIVAHMGVILTQWAIAKQTPPFETLAQKIDNLSVTTIRWDGGRWIPEGVNQHL